MLSLGSAAVVVVVVVVDIAETAGKRRVLPYGTTLIGSRLQRKALVYDNWSLLFCLRFV